MSVQIYTKSTCAPCKMLKTWFDKKGIEYTELSLDDNPSYANEVFEKSGMLMVPTTIIGDQVISGPNIALLSKALMV